MFSYHEQVIWTPGVKISELERSAIISAYKFYNQNKTATAASLGISIRTLDSKLEKYAEDDKAAEEARDAQLRRDHEFNIRQRGLDIVEEPAIISPASFANSNPPLVGHEGVSEKAMPNVMKAKGSDTPRTVKAGK